METVGRMLKHTKSLVLEEKLESKGYFRAPASCHGGKALSPKCLVWLVHGRKGNMDTELGCTVK